MQVKTRLWGSGIKQIETVRERERESFYDYRLEDEFGEVMEMKQYSRWGCMEKER